MNFEVNVRLQIFHMMSKHVYLCATMSCKIGIKHGFSCINIRQVQWDVLKTEAEGSGFQHLPRDLANVNALKNHVRYYCIKTENICYISG